MQIQALRLGPIGEPHGVVGVVDGPQHVLFPAGGVVGDEAGLQLSEVVAAAAYADVDGSALELEGVVEELLQAGSAVLERRLEDHVPDSELLDDIAGL